MVAVAVLMAQEIVVVLVVVVVVTVVQEREVRPHLLDKATVEELLLMDILLVVVEQVL